MTRAEEIRQAAGPGEFGTGYELKRSFIRGAEWADQTNVEKIKKLEARCKLLNDVLEIAENTMSRDDDFTDRWFDYLKEVENIKSEEAANEG